MDVRSTEEEFGELLAALDGCEYGPREPPEREGLIDGLLDEVEEALSALTAAAAGTRAMAGWPWHPSAEEAVLCLCGEPPDRPGDWAGLTAQLRCWMMTERGMVLGGGAPN